MVFILLKPVALKLSIRILGSHKKIAGLERIQIFLDKFFPAFRLWHDSDGGGHHHIPEFVAPWTKLIHLKSRLQVLGNG